MRKALSSLIVGAARTNPAFLVLSGDHGYALFDALRGERPDQFLNVGVAEQNMIGVAAGLARVGFRPCVYGLAAFVPIRVLEQIKLDLCHSRLPVILLGDGAGLVYSTLGVSHQCGEDIACLRPLPDISIYSPCDEVELATCWKEALSADHPCYIRLGKDDRPAVHGMPLSATAPVFTHIPSPATGAVTIIATGSMVSPCTDFASRTGIACISVPRIKPFPQELFDMLHSEAHVVVAEEHSSAGGLWTSVVENAALLPNRRHRPHRITPLCLRSDFTRSAGSWQHALHEHDMDDATLFHNLSRLCTTPHPDE